MKLLNSPKSRLEQLIDDPRYNASQKRLFQALLALDKSTSLPLKNNEPALKIIKDLDKHADK